MIESTYNVNTHCNLPYALKVWNLNSVFLKIKFLINVNNELEMLKMDERQQNR